MNKLFSIINNSKVNHLKDIDEAIHPTDKVIISNCDFSHSEEEFNKMIEELENNKKGGLYNDDLFRSK